MNDKNNCDSLEEYEIIKENYCSSPKCGIKSKNVSNSVEKLVLIPQGISFHPYFKYSVTPMKTEHLFQFEFSQKESNQKSVDKKYEKSMNNLYIGIKMNKKIENEKNESEKNLKTSRNYIRNLTVLTNKKNSGKKVSSFFNPMRTSKNNNKELKLITNKSKKEKEPTKIIQPVIPILSSKTKNPRTSIKSDYHNLKSNEGKLILKCRKEMSKKYHIKTKTSEKELKYLKDKEESDKKNNLTFKRRESHLFSYNTFGLLKNNIKSERGKRKNKIFNISGQLKDYRKSLNVEKKEKKERKDSKSKKMNSIKKKSKKVLNNLKKIFKKSNKDLKFGTYQKNNEQNISDDNNIDKQNLHISNRNLFSEEEKAKAEEDKSNLALENILARKKYQRTQTRHKTIIIFQNQIHVEKITEYTNKQKIENINEYTKQCLELIPDLLSLDKIPRSKIKIHPIFQNSNIKKIALFDLDETIVHCIGEINMKNVEAFSMKNDAKIKVQLPGGKDVVIGINIRPKWKEALNLIKDKYHIIAYTASHESYADSVLNYLDPDKTIFEYRLYRSHCVLCSFNDIKFYVKDLGIFDEFCDLKDVILIDNSVLSFAYHLDNGIPISPFYDSKTDNELYEICEFLLNNADEEDIRIQLRDKYKITKLMNLIKEQNKSSSEESSSISVVQEKDDELLTTENIFHLNETSTTIKDYNKQKAKNNTNKNLNYKEEIENTFFDRNILIEPRRSLSNKSNPNKSYKDKILG